MGINKKKKRLFEEKQNKVKEKQIQKEYSSVIVKRILCLFVEKIKKRMVILV